MATWSVLFDIVVLLGAALVLGGIVARLGQSPLIGYLLAGMLLGGPGSFHIVSSERDIEAIAELGVSLLLFSLGLEFSLQRLRSLGRTALIGGVLQVVVTLACGAGVAMAAGLSPASATAVGAMISLSSTAIVLRLLMARAEIETPHGRNSLAVLLVQDIAVVPLAVLMSLLAGGTGFVEVSLNIGRIVGLAALLIGSLYLLLNKLAVAVLGTLTLERNRELATLLAVTTGLGSTFAAHSIGLSPALGAFVAGIFLGSAPFATQVRADIASLRIVLLTLFFGAAGMVADPLWIVSHLHLVLGFLVLLTIGKTAITWIIFRALGNAAPIAAATGICLAQVGEFAFVLGSIAKERGVIHDETHLLVVSVAITSLFVGPLLVPTSARLGAWLASRLTGKRFQAETGRADGSTAPDVVIIGFGPAGEIAARALMGTNARVLVIDLNQEGVRRARTLKFEGQVGDATQLDVLEHAHIGSAKAVVITLPHHETALAILDHVRRLAPAAHRVVRSRYQRHTHEIVNAGAHAIFGDEEEIGSRIGAHLCAWIAAVQPGTPRDSDRDEH